jgi:hypothetical protein
MPAAALPPLALDPAANGFLKHRFLTPTMTRSVSVFASCGVAALLALASGCATAPAGKQFLSVDSFPAGAAISVDGIESKDKTPAKLTLDATKQHQIVVSKAGYRNGTTVVSSLGGKSLSPSSLDLHLTSSYVPLVVGSASESVYDAKLNALVALETAKSEKKISDADYKIALKQINSLKN